MCEDVDFSFELLQEVGRLRTSGFTGLGVIFYRPPMRLPVMPLGSPRQMPYELPIAEATKIAAVLAELADASSPFHDGFHLIDMVSRRLTHIAHFVAPPLPSVNEPMPANWPSGARQMTALLVSRMKAVATVGLLSGTDATVFSHGKLARSVRIP